MTHRALVQQPPPVTLTDVTTGESVEAPLIPTRFAEQIVAQYVTLRPFAATSDVQQYVGTASREIPSIEFRTKVDSVAEREAVEQFVFFGESLMYPPADGLDVRTARPPDVLLVWPGTLAIRARVHSIRIERTRFNRRGQFVEATVRMTLREVSDARITSAEVRRLGSLRGVGSF